MATPKSRARPRAKMPAITALDDWTEPDNLLVYGDSGIGKSVLAGTLPGRVLLIAIDPGATSIKRLMAKAKIRPNPDLKVTKPADFREFMLLLRDLNTKANHGTLEWDWIVVDSITQLFTMAMREILDKAHEQSAKRSLDIPAIQDYGEIQNLMKRVVRRVNDLPCGTLWLAHAMYHEDEEGETIILPDIPGRNGTDDPTTMSRYVCGLMQMYGYYKAVKDKSGNDHRRLIVTRSGPYFGKDRYDALGKSVLDPDMAKIVALIRGTSEGEK